MMCVSVSIAGSASCPGSSEQAPTSLPGTPAYSVNLSRDLANPASERCGNRGLSSRRPGPSRARRGRGGGRLVLPDDVGAQADGRDLYAVGDDLDDPVVVVAAEVGGSSNLLVRYINQGRAEGGRPHLSPRQAARILLTRPDRLTAGQQQTLPGLEAACPEMTALASLVRSFAALLIPGPGNDGKLRQWITGARAADLPHLHSFTRGLDLDIQAATAALTLPHHNGRTEGVNTRTKMIKRQMYGRAGFTLLRHRILLN
jgi:hypothetical protein